MRTAGIFEAKQNFSALIEAAYYFWLSQAYRYGDLSLVYPLARGSAPLFVPLFAALFLGERLSAPAALGVLLVVGGVIALHLPGLGRKALQTLARRLRQPGTRYALLSGGASFTVSD